MGPNYRQAEKTSLSFGLVLTLAEREEHAGGLSGGFPENRQNDRDIKAKGGVMTPPFPEASITINQRAARPIPRHICLSLIHI